MQSQNFWDAFGGDVKRSEVKPLIEQNATFETLCEQPTFIDEYLAMNDYVVNYLSTDDSLNRMVGYLVDMTEYKSAQYSKKAHYPYFSFMILSAVNTKVYDRLFQREDLLAQLFALAKKDPEIYVTAQGYLASLIKNWISPQNSRPAPFFNFLNKHIMDYIVPMTHNLSSSNAEIIKEVLTSRSEAIEKQQKALFEYLPYYYLNEEFDSDFYTRNPDTFENIYGILRTLNIVKMYYLYKPEFISKLWTNTQVHFLPAHDDLLILRVQILKYLAQSGQLKNFPADKSAYQVTKTLKNLSKIRLYLNVFLEFLVLVTRHPYPIPPETQPYFIGFLVDVLSGGNIDIITSKVFAVLENSLPWILENQQLRFILQQWIAGSLTQQSQLRSTSTQINSPYISLHYFAKLIQKIDQTKVDPQFSIINEWRGRFEKDYRKLAFESINSEEMIHKKESIKFELTTDYEFVGADGKEASGMNSAAHPSSQQAPPLSQKPNIMQKLESKFKSGFDFNAVTFDQPSIAPANDPFSGFR